MLDEQVRGSERGDFGRRVATVDAGSQVAKKTRQPTVRGIAPCQHVQTFEHLHRVTLKLLTNSCTRCNAAGDTAQGWRGSSKVGMPASCSERTWRATSQGSASSSSMSQRI